jgi:hypothetical protein
VTTETYYSGPGTGKKPRVAARGRQNANAAPVLTEIISEFPGYSRRSGVDSVRADGKLPADRAVLTKEYPLMKTASWSLTVAALLLALAPWAAVCVRANEAGDQAVKAIQKMGGRITRDMKAKGKPIVRVRLGEANVTDAGLKELAGLKQLRHLELSFTQVTDAGLKLLARLKHLRELDLRNTRVTNAGLKELAGLKQLQTLFLDGTEVTDAGLKHLAGLKQLRRLDLKATHVTDAGLKELAGLRQLQTLYLAGTQVTDAGLKELAGLKKLRHLVFRQVLLFG